jgi:hypothetical protein
MGGGPVARLDRPDALLVRPLRILHNAPAWLLTGVSCSLPITKGIAQSQPGASFAENRQDNGHHRSGKCRTI